MPNYNIEMNHRVKKMGGGTSVYIHTSLQYKTFQLGGDCNSVFIEILKTINTKCNLICGYVYRQPFMSLQHFNELLARVLGMLQDDSGLAKKDFINLLSSFFSVH